jgi:peptide deformylase
MQEKRNDTHRRLKIKEDSEAIKQKSEDVKEIDQRISMHIIEMKNMLVKNHFSNDRIGYAIAHCQVVEHTPLRFFVMQSNLAEQYDLPTVIYNARILDQSEPYEVLELCLSFPYHGRAKINRYRKIEVEYQIEENGKLSKPIKKKFEDFIAQLFQHEIQHFEGDTIYNQLIRESEQQKNDSDKISQAETEKTDDDGKDDQKEGVAKSN